MPGMPAVDLHPGIAPLGFLVGTWRGSGRGEYPTIDPFTYTEEAVFRAPPGKPFLAYTQVTHGADGRTLHAESGYWRLADGKVEAVIAQPTGLVEVQVGTLEGRRIELRSLVVAETPSALAVREVERTLDVGDDAIAYELSMAYRRVEMTLHLRAQLTRVPAGPD